MLLEITSDILEKGKYVGNRILKDAELMAKIKDNPDIDIDISDFGLKIVIAHESFFLICEELDYYTSDDEIEFVAAEIGCSCDVAEHALWYSHCHSMNNDLVTFIGKCPKCGCSEIFLRGSEEDGEAFYEYLQCDGCKISIDFDEFEEDKSSNMSTFLNLNEKLTLQEKEPVVEPNLRPEYRPTSYIFKVATGYRKLIWRKIQINSSETLEAFADEIMRAFSIDEEHLYGFYMHPKGKRYNVPYYSGPSYRGHTSAKEKYLCDLHLTTGDKFLFVYNYIRESHFMITLVDVVDDVVDFPEVIAWKGEYQYDDY